MRSDKILIVGLGSPIMSDDAIGLEVAQAIEDMNFPDVEVKQEAIGGLDIIPILWGYKHVIIVDAIQTREYLPGTVILFNPEDFDDTIGDASPHDINLATAMKIGREVEPDMMPDEVKFVGVEAKDIITVNEGMTSELIASLPDAINAVVSIIEEFRAR